MEALTQGPVAFRIREFDMVQGVLLVPENAIWYRAYDPTKPILPATPLFFGDMEVAHLYARETQGRRLGEFRTTRQLRLLDLRYVSAIMHHLFQFMTTHPGIIRDISIALGTCSLARQIELLMDMAATASTPDLPKCIQRMQDFAALPPTARPTWVNPIEPQGVRVGITDLDYKVMSFFKELFPVDGVIAPATPTPFHNQGNEDPQHSILYEEIVLFEPSATLVHVQDRPVTDRVKYYVTTAPFDEAHIRAYYRGTLARLRPPRVRYMGGGAGENTTVVEVRDAAWERTVSDTAYRKQVEGEMREWKRVARDLRKACPGLTTPAIHVRLGAPGEP